jgi:hypothetical protein
MSLVESLESSACQCESGPKRRRNAHCARWPIQRVLLVESVVRDAAWMIPARQIVGTRTRQET